MGQSVSNTSDRTALLSTYDEVDTKCDYGSIVCHKVTKQTFLLKQLNFPDQDEYKKTLKLYEAKKEKLRQNVLNLIQLENQSKSLFCSQIYRLSIIYEFAQITLAQEIDARKPELRYFQQQDLWSIVQSCLYGLVQISQNIILQPNRVYIMSDGLVKIIDPDMITNNSWYMLDQNIYYSPQRFHNFTNSNKISTTQQQAMFSLGATLLNTAILESCFDCYQYGSHRFNQKKLQEKLEKLETLYSEDFKTVICGLLEINPSNRMSMQEIQEIVGKLANQDTQEQQEASYQQPQDPQPEPKPSMQQDTKQSLQQQPFRQVGNYQQSTYYSHQHHHFQRQTQVSHPQPVIKFKNIQIKQSLEPIIQYPKEHLSKFQHKRLVNYKEVEQSQVQSISYGYHVSNTQLDGRLESVRSKNVSQFERSGYYDSGVKDYTSVYKTQREKDENLFTDPKLMEQIRKDMSQITARRSLLPTSTTTKHPSGLSSHQGVMTPAYIPQRQDSRPIHQPQTHYQQDGKVFEGIVINGMKQGFGKLSYPQGPFYLGNFLHDKMHGKGILYYQESKPAYDGQWFQDQFHGKGILYNQNPLEQNQPFDFNDFNLVEDYWTKYQGQFVNDNKQGLGKLFLSNGQVFQGYFERDCINGEGVFHDTFGGNYQGRWDNNILEERFSQR